MESKKALHLTKVSTFMALSFSSSIRNPAVPSFGLVDVLLVTLVSRSFDEIVSTSANRPEALERQDWYISKKTDWLGQSSKTMNLYYSWWAFSKSLSLALLSLALDLWTAEPRQTAIKKQATPGKRISALIDLTIQEIVQGWAWKLDKNDKVTTFNF